MEKEKKINLASVIILGGFVFAMCFCLVVGYALHYGFPFKTFLVNIPNHFGDFLDFRNFAKPYSEGGRSSYFPFAHIFISMFNSIPNAIVSLIVFLSVFLGIFTFLNFKFFYSDKLSKIINARNIFTMTFLMYPVLCALDRGNFEVLVFCFVAFSILLFFKEKYAISALLLACACCMKPFYVVFMVLFLQKKKFLHFFGILFLCPLISILSLMHFDKYHMIEQIEALLINIKLYSYIFITKSEGIAYSSSIFGGLSALSCQINPVNFDGGALFLKVKNFLTISSLIFVFWSFKLKKNWQILFVLCSVANLLSPICPDYRLILYIIPFYYFINEKPEKFDMAITILYSLLFIPKNFFFFAQNCSIQPWTINIIPWSIQTVLNPIIIVAILVLIFISNLKFLNTKKDS